ncbi:MAG: helix-hairpin-helix domain-containing protein [candidate division WOR-3 bacterium]|nr:MAG: helix-hairpin-helix domain-containing protein [candidate division WOR-3 bacterium]
MKRRTIIVLCMVIAVLIAVTIAGYVQRQRLRQQYTLLIEEAAVCISINHASAEELTTLPGIGPLCAQRIIEYREAHGPFRSLDDLKDVKGIGEKIFSRIAPYIKL